MKQFVRSVLSCLLAGLAFTDVHAELAAITRPNSVDALFRSLRGAQLVIETLAQHSLLRIQAEDSEDSQIDDQRPAKKRHQHGKSAEAIVTGESYRLKAGESTNGAVVLIGGNGEVDGTVNGDLVLIGSKATFSGTVNGDLVTVGSNLTILSGAVTNGDYVSVASAVKGEQELTTNGERVTLNTYSPVVPAFKEALSNIVQLRPMSPSSIFGWVWAIIMLIVSLVLALIFPKVFVGTEAIIRAMTRAERNDPNVLNSSRRRRIAAGSGTTLPDVNRLVKQFTEMQKLMKQLSGGGKRASLLAPVLYLEGCRLCGIYLSGVNLDVLSLSYQKGRIPPSFLKIPIFISSGIQDHIAPADRAREVYDSIKRTGFQRVRFESFPQGHMVNNDHTIEALRWFRALQNSR